MSANNEDDDIKLDTKTNNETNNEDDFDDDFDTKTESANIGFIAKIVQNTGMPLWILILIFVCSCILCCISSSAVYYMSSGSTTSTPPAPPSVQSEINNTITRNLLNSVNDPTQSSLMPLPQATTNSAFENMRQKILNM